MIGRTVNSNEELLQLTEEVTKAWKRTTDTAALLTALEGNHYFDLDMNPINLLLTTGTQLILAGTKSDRDARCKVTKKCLKLIQTLAENEHTDINRLIALLRQYTVKSKRTFASCIGEYEAEHPQSKLMSKYVDILFLISVREDFNPEELRKLLSHHDERGQRENNYIDGSLVFDLAAIAKQDCRQSDLLYNHLLNLLRMADKGIIDADTIYHALRTPKDCTQNIGVLIANIYNTPDCYMILARLLRHLRRHGFHINAFLPSLSDFKNVSKEDFLRYLKSVNDSDQIQEGIYLADPKDAAGKIMYQARGIFPCELESGTLNAVASVIGMRVVRNAIAANEAAEEARIAVATNISIPSHAQPSAPPLKAEEAAHLTKVANISIPKLVRPSAPPMTEDTYKESTALFAKEPPAEYNIVPVNQSTTDVDILSAHLRMAAAYKKNDTIADLVKRGAALDYNRDVGDMCADAPPLYHAAEKNNLDGVNILLDLGANVNCQRRNRMTALSIATQFNHESLICTLLDRGADVDFITRERNSPLSLAVEKCSVDIVDKMVEKLCVKYAGNPQGLLSFLKEKDHYRQCLESVPSGSKLLSLMKLKDFLIANGISKEEVYAIMPTAYTFKVGAIKDEYMEELAKQSHAVQRDICNKIVNDPESWEYKLARFKSGVLQPRSGAGMIGTAEGTLQFYQELDNNLCLEMARRGLEFRDKLISKERCEEVKQAVIKRIESGANINGVLTTNGLNTWDGNTPLCEASSFGNIDLIMILLELGADINQKAVMTRETLRVAISKKSIIENKIPGVQKFLDTHQGDVFEFLPEEFAALFGENQAAEFLQTTRLEKNRLAQLAANQHFVPPVLVFVPPAAAPVQYQEPAQLPPPAYADHKKALRVLHNADGTVTLLPPDVIPAQPVVAAEEAPVKKPVDLNYELWLTAGNGKHEVQKIKELLDAGAEINNVQRASALFAAAQANDTDVIKLLLERGADPTLPHKVKKQIAEYNLITKSGEQQQRWKEYLAQQTGEYIEILPETIAELNGNTENADMLRKAREAYARAAHYPTVATFVAPKVVEPVAVAVAVEPIAVVAEPVAVVAEPVVTVGLLVDLTVPPQPVAAPVAGPVVAPVAHQPEKKVVVAEPVTASQDLISFTDDVIVAQPVAAAPLISTVDDKKLLEEAFLSVYGPYKPVESNLLSSLSMFTPEVTAPAPIAPVAVPVGDLLNLDMPIDAAVEKMENAFEAHDKQEEDKLKTNVEKMEKAFEEHEEAEMQRVIDSMPSVKLFAPKHVASPEPEAVQEEPAKPTRPAPMRIAVATDRK